MTEQSLTLDVVAIVISVLALAASVLGWFVNRRTARKYGDVAGTEAAIKYEEEKANKARIVALRSMLAEVDRIQLFVSHNKKLSTASS